MSRRLRAIALAAALGLVALSCGEGTAGNQVFAASESFRLQGDSTAVPDVAAAANRFAVDVYHQLAAADDNLVFSPHSIAIALAMTRAGAAGTTASEMDDVLHWTGLIDPHRGFNALDLLLAQRSGTFTRSDGTEAAVVFRVANALWGQRDTTFQPGFLDLLAEQYGAGMHLVDYQANAGGARQEINDWVSNETEDRIEDLIPEGTLGPLTRLVLTNAVYLLAPWESPFVEGATTPGTFTRIDRSTVQAELMRQTTRFPFATGDGWQAVELPYAGGQLAMIVIVPDAGRFAEIEAGLDGDQLDQIGSSLEERRVNLQFPSFEFRTQAGLVPTLGALGLDTAFDPQRADFSGMTSEEQLFISDVIHEAFIAVDEEGTEAAAATAVVMATMSAQPAPQELVVDRPFLFEIVDRQTGAILFLGRVMDPTR